MESRNKGNESQLFEEKRTEFPLNEASFIEKGIVLRESGKV